MFIIHSDPMSNKVFEIKYIHEIIKIKPIGRRPID